MNIKIASYNVHRFEEKDAHKNINDFLVTQWIDICGMQEVSGVAGLKSLECVSSDEFRFVFDGHYKSYGNGLVYRKSKFEFVNTETFIISKDTKKNVKTQLAVRLKLLSTGVENGKFIDFHVTHLTHTLEDCRLYEIQNVVKNIESRYSTDFYILGDLNSLCEYDYSTPKLNDIIQLRKVNHWEPPRFEVYNYLKDNGYVDLFEKVNNPTCRFDTRVDYIWKSPLHSDIPNIKIEGLETLNLKGSDHSPIVATIKMNTTPPIKFIDTSYRYGFHVQKQTSIYKTIKDVLSREVSAMQLFVSNPKSKYPPSFDLYDLENARKCLELHQEMYVVIHGCLLYNLAGTVEGDDYHQSLAETIRGLTAELDYAVALGRPSDVGIGVIIHPGSRKNKDEGHSLVAKTIAQVLTRKTPESEKLSKSLGISEDEFITRRKLIIENSAGEGTKLCSTLKEIQSVISMIPLEIRSQVKVCIDSAHFFGAGQCDWGKDGQIVKFYKDFDEIIGLDKLEVFHFNDSSKEKGKDAPFGSRKDRHQNLGLGYIFDIHMPERYNNIRTFVEQAHLHKIPIIGEPPGEGKDDWAVVKKLLSGTSCPLEWEK
jgi:deoxyribonuclease-4